MATMKVKPWHESQGDHVVIEEADFDPAVHQPIEPNAPAEQSAEPKRRGRKPAEQSAE